MLGIEHEFFILKNNKCISIEEMSEILLSLKKYGFRIYNPQKCTLKMSKDVDGGYIAISNDFCTHILEIAFAPSPDFLKTQQMVTEYLNIIYEVLNNHSVQIYNKAYLEIPNNRCLFLPHEKLSWMREREVPNLKYSHRFLTSQLTSTQYTIESSNPDKTISNLGILYWLECLVPYLFTNSNSQEIRCIRPLMWRDSFPESYIFNGFLDQKFNSLEDYNQKFRDAKDCIRDYSLIAPRLLGRLEFRGACSQPSIDDMLDLGAYRMASMEILEKNLTEQKCHSKDAYYKICENGTCDEEYLGAILYLLKQVLKELKDKSYLKRVENVINRIDDVKTYRKTNIN